MAEISNGEERKRLKLPDGTTENIQEKRPRISLEDASTGAQSTGQLQQESSSLSWPCIIPYTSVDAENSLLPVLMKLKKNERGMMKDQPYSRLKEIKKAIKKVQVPLSQALSLRRHHIVKENPSSSLVQLNLGTYVNIRKSADLFEKCVEKYLKRSNIPFVPEELQRQRHKSTHGALGQPQPPTPDYLFEIPVCVTNHGISQVTADSFHIHWMEVKHFYGASTIPHDNKSAVGCVLQKSQKYRDLYGPGAIVFAYGAGDRLAQSLIEMDVIALDCGPVNMDSLRTHLKTW
eukprot:CAMPEP_0172433326 /NCGR_PEP_ID=MMETSP1064-20121228/67680_1 /TAXON_ID=202472 /ORGANISM="Aulacoseira subarctica , Strain CCAP 1002/5" /LENGTH=289 /DNA_ID=CAMNT_0013181189 /DNA_START=62 /DNA_END=928 /DNA_ORIENTATION=+